MSGILGAFFEMEESSKSENKKGNAQPSINSVPTPLNANLFQQATAAPVQSYQPSPSVSNTEIDKFTAHFDELFDKSNLPGPDYYEFRKMVEALNIPGMDDDTKMKAAFAGLKVQGLTKDILIQSAKQYISIIDSDGQNFSSAIDQKVKGDIEAKKLNLKNMQDAIVKKQALISQMQQEIIEETTNIATSTAEITEQERKINEKANAYKIASETRKNLINSDIQKINIILN